MKRLALLIAVLPALAWGQDELNDPEWLWEDATLYRDEWGVPHVYADELRAMAFAFGYAQAEDHIEPMLMAYRAARGRTAEVLGEGRLPQDIYAVRMRFGELAQEALDEADLDVVDLCEGFALGVNAWVDEHRGEAPAWAQEVEPHDVLALLHLFLMAHAPFDLPEADVRDKGMLSAHAWAVAPEYSAEGDAMLVLNPHAEFEGIFRWYEAQLSAGEYEMSGATIYGLPLILMGHNARLGWALAPNEADTADLFDHEKFENLDEETMRRRTVLVRDGEDVSEHGVKVWRSGLGPVVAANMGRPLSWRVGGYGEFDSLGQLLEMGMARDLAEFGDALEARGLPNFNVVYADQEGNIYYLYHARTGERRGAGLRTDATTARTVWERPVSAFDTRVAWGDELRLESMPALLNPEAGYIVGSGLPPWDATGDSGMRRSDFPYWLARDRVSAASMRVRDVFDRGPRSVRDLQSLLFDLVATEAGQAVNTLLAAAEAWPGLVEAGHPDLPAALDMLAEWNGLADTGSMAMTFFHVWLKLFKKSIEGDGTPDANGGRQDFAIARTEAQRKAVLAASDAARLMVNTYQTVFVPWGEVHTLRRGDREIALAGGTSGSPIFRSGDQDYDAGVWTARSGYAFAMIVRFSDPPQALSLVPFGASDRPESPHFADQMPLLRDRRMRVVRSEREEVLQGATYARGATLEFVEPNRRVRIRVLGEKTLSGRLVTAQRFRQRAENLQAAFSPYVEPVVEPVDAEVTVDLIFSIPDEVCALEHLESLAVYSFHPETGWLVVQDQALDEEARVIRARDFFTQVYVVLGPSQYLRQDPVARPAAALFGPGKGRIATQILPEEKPLKTRRSFRLSKEDEMEEALGESEGRAAGPDPRTDSPENPFGASPGIFSYRRGGQDRTEDETDNRMPSASRPDLVPEAPPPPPETEAVAPSPRSPSNDAVQAPQATPDPPADPAVKPSSSYEISETPEGVLVVRGRSGPRGAPSDSSGVTYSDEVPTEISRGKPFRFQLAPDGARASELKVGRSLELVPPTPGAIFRLNAEKAVRAQAYIARETPGPLPAGLAPFTPVFTVRYEDSFRPCTVAIILHVAPERCLPKNSARLTLYTHDEESGWQPLQGASSTARLSYQGIDLTARTYAVLGPAELLRDASQ